MKSLFLTACLLVGLVVPQLNAGDPPKKPGPEHQKLAVWTGKWKLEESSVKTPFGPAVKSAFVATGRFAAGGFQLELRGKGRSDLGPYEWCEVHYFDSRTRSYRTFFYDSDGVSNDNGDQVEGNKWTSSPWEQTAEGKVYKCRSVVTFAPDGKSFVYDWSYSEDGATWKPWLTGKSKKVGNVK